MSNEMMPCDQNCTRDMDGICDPRCGERWADIIDAEQAQAKQERRAHLNALLARWAQWNRINSIARQACGMGWTFAVVWDFRHYHVSRNPVRKAKYPAPGE